jgi:hypothetical protein
MLATLKYLADIPLYQEEKPYTLYGFPNDVSPTTNCVFDIHENVPVADIRGRESEYGLEGCGFEIHNRPS